MISNFISRLHNISSGFGRILKQNQCLYPLKKKVLLREFRTDFPTRYYDDKYEELRNRLTAVPYLKMVKKEADSVKHDLCYEKDDRLEDVLKWFSKVISYNTGRDSSMCTAVLLKTYCAYGFSTDDGAWNQWDSDRWRSAIILAWCIELFHAFYVVQDDIMDQSTLRRGQPCWYKIPDVGLRAIIDFSLLQSGIFKLLQRHFAGTKCYMSLLHELLQALQEAMYGQCLDMMFHQKNQKPRFDMFTFEKYETLSEYKLSHFGLRLPVHLALHLAGGISAKEFSFTREFCLKLGLYLQIQDDFLDCFGKSEVTENFGNDIREGKCTWFSVKFLEEASEPMKKDFFENYGIEEEDAITKVLTLYRKANLMERFEETEEQLCTEIRTLIESKKCIKSALFYDLFAYMQNIAYSLRSKP